MGYTIDRAAKRTINGTEYEVTAVNGLDRVEINNRLHYLNVEIDELRAKQAELVEMRDLIDREIEIRESEDLFDQMFGG